MTGTTFEPITVRRGFEHILDQLEAAIVNGSLGAGDRLPAERDLATQFDVARTSVREALRVLEALGIVKIQRGAESGGAWLRDEPGNAFTHLLRLSLSLNHVTIQHVIDMLILISCWATRTVTEAQDRTRAVKQLQAIVDAMADRNLDQAKYHNLDAEFHLKIVNLTGNHLANLVMDGCWNPLRRMILAPIEDDANWMGTHGGLVAEHVGIVRAIKDGDPGLAEDRMRLHLETWCGKALSAAATTGIRLT